MEHWSRGCGSGGIGYSGYIVEYKDGVKQANWVENEVKNEFSQTGKHFLGFGEPFNSTSTQRMSYNPYGKVGEDLTFISERHDRELVHSGVKADILFRHGNFAAPDEECHASLNELAMSERRVGDPKVQAYMWTGKKNIDRSVPLSTNTMSLTQRKAAEWNAEAAPDNMYRTSSKTVLYSTAMRSASTPVKQGTLRPCNDQGLMAGSGRIPLGPNVDECDKNYRHIGLRNTYCNTLNKNKHILPDL
eukprot:gene23228-30451_t